MAHRAFTLIEILTVVAILALLAAIALPSFLAAQTRAKVARARADLRTIASAIEAYRADWSACPSHHFVEVEDRGFEFHIGGNATALCTPDPDWDGGNPLTSPVAYLAAMPRDPFANPPAGAPAEAREYLYANWEITRRIAQGTLWEAHYAGIAEGRGAHSIHSRGPDGDGGDSEALYDPTNGTRSGGDIIFDARHGFGRAVTCPWQKTLE